LYIFLLLCLHPLLLSFLLLYIYTLCGSSGNEAFPSVSVFVSSSLDCLSDILGCDGVCLDMYLLTFWRSVQPSLCSGHSSLWLLGLCNCANFGNRPCILFTCCLHCDIS
jgi:hypothetical protein